MHYIRDIRLVLHHAFQKWERNFSDYFVAVVFRASFLPWTFLLGFSCHVMICDLICSVFSKMRGQVSFDDGAGGPFTTVTLTDNLQVMDCFA